MGIHKFSSVFTGDTIHIRDFAGERVAIDAYHEYYRASLGAKDVAQLTDADGNRTLYLNVILSLCAEFQKNCVDQLWIFDNAAHQAKNRVLAARRAIRQKATKAIEELDAQLEQQATDTIPLVDVYTPDDVEAIEIPLDTITETDKAACAALIAERHRQEKRAFQVVPLEIERMKHMFDLLGIKWIDAPPEIEAEQLAAQLSAHDYVHAVYSGDTDPIAFGAKRHYRRVARDKLIRYTQMDIRRQIAVATNTPIEQVGRDEIIKICVVLGCDFAPKTPGIGDKTVLRKFRAVELTEEQKQAVDIFKAVITFDDMFIYNRDEQVFTADRKAACIAWLVTMGFNEARLKKAMDKVSVTITVV